MRISRLSVLALTLAGAVACTGSSGNNAILRTDPSASPTLPTVPTKCCVPPEQPGLRISVSPTSGPPRTTVGIHVAGCGVLGSGDGPTISFNNDAENFAARNDPETVRLVPFRRHGTKADATYTVVARDRTGGIGMFFVQCGPTVRQARFKVTG